MAIWLLLVFLVLIIVILFSIKKPSGRMLSAENLADDLTGTNGTITNHKISVSNKDINFANLLATISASLKIAMKDKTHMKQDVEDDRQQINNIIQNIEKR